MREIDTDSLAEYRLQRSGVERPDGQVVQTHVLEALLDHAGVLGRIPHRRDQADGLVAEPAGTRLAAAAADAGSTHRKSSAATTSGERCESTRSACRTRGRSQATTGRRHRARLATGRPRAPGAGGSARPARCRAAPAPAALTAPRTTETLLPPPLGSSGLGRTGPLNRGTAACHNTVLPMPAAPTRTSAAGPRSTWERNAPISRSSSSRPTNPTAIPGRESASSCIQARSRFPCSTGRPSRVLSHSAQWAHDERSHLHPALNRGSPRVHRPTGGVLPVLRGGPRMDGARCDPRRRRERLSAGIEDDLGSRLSSARPRPEPVTASSFGSWIDWSDGPPTSSGCGRSPIGVACSWHR